MSAPVCQSADTSSDTSEILRQTPESPLSITVGFSLQPPSVNAKTVHFDGIRFIPDFWFSRFGEGNQERGE